MNNTTTAAGVGAAQPVLAVYIVTDLVLLCGAALFAGLTLALMSLDTLSLEIIASSGSEPSRTYAAKVVPLRKLGNQLLCTLVLGNVMVNTLIAQVTDRFVEGWVGTLVSTAIITLGGEIIPQATMSSMALKVGASSAPVVRFFVFAFYPVCKPLALLLDKVIGSDPGQVYDKQQLRHLIVMHAKKHSRESGLSEGDMRLMMGAMEIHEKCVRDAFTPISDVYMLEWHQEISLTLIEAIQAEGHSRIPVYKHTRHNIEAVLYAKDLLGVNMRERTKVGDFVRFYPHRFFTVTPETKLIEALRQFQSGRPHMAMVQEVNTVGMGDPRYDIIGIVTLDDVLEHLIQDDIRDEHDEDAAADGTLLGGGNPARRNAALPVSGTLINAFVLFQSTGGINRFLPLSMVHLKKAVRRVDISEAQLKAAALLLCESLPCFSDVSTEEMLVFLKQVHSVLSFEVRPSTTTGGPRHDLLLYSQRATSSVMTLIVSGAVEVVIGSGEDLFTLDIGAWQVLGVSAMEGMDVSGSKRPSPFRSDFTARVTKVSTVIQMTNTGVSTFLKKRHAGTS